jgi:DNA-binding PadR family transcriptional regulator
LSTLIKKGDVMKKKAIGEQGIVEIADHRGTRLFGGTSRHKYETIIFESISNGCKKNYEIRKFIEKEYSNKFNEIDKSRIGDGSLRWVKNLDWKKYYMKEVGLIKYNKNKKIWEITEKGFKRFHAIKKENLSLK